MALTTNNIQSILIRRRLRTSLLIIGIWIITGFFTAVYEYLFLANYPGVQDTAAMAEYDFRTSLVAALAWAFIGGVLFSLVELFYLQDRLENRRFTHVIGIKMLTYSALLVVLNVLTSALYNALSLQRPISDPLVRDRVIEFLTSMAFWHPLLPFLLLLFLTLFIIQLNSKFGAGELWQFVTGKYFKPKEEQRIFMFLDLNDSTAIAEKLGHIRFFHFMNDFFRDITNDILQNDGEIVEYVGDEIVVTWTVDRGLFNGRCVRCFHDITTRIEALTPRYQRKYGIAPTFKAGIHFGKATIGEIGKIKKEIVFSGDVMNTTSRIQNLCRDLREPLVISEDLMRILKPVGVDLHFEELGEAHLRGKAAKTRIYTARRVA